MTEPIATVVGSVRIISDVMLVSGLVMAAVTLLVHFFSKFDAL